jgi:Ca2+-binding RTX toxin-like protein
MATINGGPGNNRIAGTNQADTIHGGGGNDVINAQAGNDNVFGDAGNDSIGGGGGNDFMDGGTGNDFVQGGAGNDVLFGGVNGGRDRLAGDAPAGGGTGIDEFQFNAAESGSDRIFDFGNPRAVADPQTADHIVLLDTTTQDILDVYRRPGLGGRWCAYH